MTILACCMGRYPYATEHGYWSLLHAIQQQPVPMPPDAQYSRQFCDFICRALEKDHTRRPSADVLLLHPFIDEMSGLIPRHTTDASVESININRRHDIDKMALLILLKPIEDWILRHLHQKVVNIVNKSKVDDIKVHRNEGIKGDLAAKGLKTKTPADQLRDFGLTDQFLNDFHNNIEQCCNNGQCNPSIDQSCREFPFLKIQLKQLAAQLGVPEDTLTAFFIDAAGIAIDDGNQSIGILREAGHEYVNCSSKQSTDTHCPSETTVSKPAEPVFAVKTKSRSHTKGNRTEKAPKIKIRNMHTKRETGNDGSKIAPSNTSVVVPAVNHANNHAKSILEANVSSGDDYDDDDFCCSTSFEHEIDQIHDSGLLVTDIPPETIVVLQSGATEIKDDSLFLSVGSPKAKVYSLRPNISSLVHSDDVVISQACNGSSIGYIEKQTSIGVDEYQVDDFEACDDDDDKAAVIANMDYTNYYINDGCDSYVDDDDFET